ncbi:MAG: hypothetical protein HYY37_05280 [Candidatus Aenigmarchaeota archaeon]|nr:hypothetical protein [Candidatus Aenigmarchaeota archaeon]
MAAISICTRCNELYLPGTERCDCGAALVATCTICSKRMDNCRCGNIIR